MRRRGFGGIANASHEGWGFDVLNRQGTSVQRCKTQAHGFRHWDLEDLRDASDLVLAQLASGGSTFLLRAWCGNRLELETDATHFGFVMRSSTELSSQSGTFRLRGGMYWESPSAASVSGDGCGIVVSEFGYRGLFQLGGPVEKVGRLKYIDGCSDTLLLSPVIKGEACLNLLYLPRDTDQTAHTHPSFRAGLVFSGSGVCRTDEKTIPLRAGSVFVIEADQLHAFQTQSDPLVVIAFHPDSDFGPSHDDHPMVNRTVVDGVSASKMSYDERGIDRDEI